jgi:hypothetical protein
MASVEEEQEMWRCRSVWLIAVLALGLGCASKKELDQARAELEECKKDKVASQDAARACEDRFQAEVRQWENMESVIQSVIPKTLEDFQKDKQQILELVPEQARKEVQQHLDQFSDVMARGFQVLKEDSEQILADLEVTKTKLDLLGDRTSSIDEAVEKTLHQAIVDRQQLEQAAAAIVAEIHDFDRSFISDKASSDKLNLNRKQRETIQLFHDGLVGKLVALGEQKLQPEGEQPEGEQPEVLEGASAQEGSAP